MNGEPTEVIATDLALTGMEAGAKPESERFGGLPDRRCAANRPGGPVEGGHKAIACCLDLTTTKAAKLIPHGPIMVVEKGSPPLIAERCRLLGGPHDIGEHDRRKDALDLDAGPLAGQELDDLVVHEGMGQSDVTAGNLDGFTAPRCARRGSDPARWG